MLEIHKKSYLYFTDSKTDYKFFLSFSTYIKKVKS